VTWESAQSDGTTHRFENIYGASRQSEGHTDRQPDVDASILSSMSHLFIIIVALLIDHVEEP
jgi:hypothetical protein